jgi:hypothetical protein
MIGPGHLEATAGSTVKVQDRLTAQIARLADSERDAPYLEILLSRRHITHSCRPSQIRPVSQGSGGEGYDLVTVFDCLHDMGDPISAARHVHSTLKPDGAWMIVEPNAGDRVEENLNPVGCAYYGFSTLRCTPASLSQEVGLALGAQAGEARIREVVLAGGFTRFRRVAETPFNLVPKRATDDADIGAEGVGEGADGEWLRSEEQLAAWGLRAPGPTRERRIEPPSVLRLRGMG